VACRSARYRLYNRGVALIAAEQDTAVVDMGSVFGFSPQGEA